MAAVPQQHLPKVEDAAAAAVSQTAAGEIQRAAEVEANAAGVGSYVLTRNHKYLLHMQTASMDAAQTPQHLGICCA